MLLKQIGLSLRKWTYSFAEILMVFPIILAIMHFYIVPEQRLLMLISFSFIYFIVIMLYDLIKLQSILVHLLLAIIAGGIAVYVSDTLIIGLLVGTLSAYFWLRGILVARLATRRLYPDIHFGIGLGAYAFAYVPFRFYTPLKEEMYLLFTLSGAAFLILAILIFNASRLENQSLTKKGIGKRYPALLRLNRIYIACFLLFVSGIAYLATKINLFGHGGFHLNKGVPIPIPMFIPNISIGDAGLGGPEGFGHPNPGNPLIGKITVIAIGAFVAYYLIKVLMRLLRLFKFAVIPLFAWLRRLLLGLERKPVLKTRDYEDEYSWTGFYEKPKKKSSEESLLARIARLLAREPKWEQLPNNREKIRYLYRHWMFDFMRRGYLFKRSLTPAETLADLRLSDNEVEPSGRQLTAIYERVRYGGDTVSVSDEETELVRETIGKTD
jgi:hypothetical protein